MSVTRDDGASRHFRLAPDRSPASSSSTSLASRTDHGYTSTKKRQAPCELPEDSQSSRKRGLACRPPRASQACRSCAASKVRCDDLRTCRRCLKRGIPCVRPNFEQCHQGGTDDAVSDSCMRVSCEEDDCCAPGIRTRDIAEAPLTRMTPINPITSGEDDCGNQIMDDGHLVTLELPTPPQSLVQADPSQLFDDIWSFDNLVDVPLTDTTEWLRSASLCAEFDASFLLPLPFIDLPGCPEDTTMHGPGDLTARTPESLPTQGKTGFEDAVMAHNATLGSWKPTSEDYLATAKASLYVPLDEQILLGEGLDHVNPAVIGECLSPARRDQIIVAMSDGAHTAHSLLAARAFPSAEALDKFVKVFLTNQENSASAFIHIGTFSPSSCSLSLLIACIVSGAASSPSPAARKFGLGLFDVLRLYLAASGERDNSLSRNLSYVQSLMILSETGFWSGDQRKSEMSDFLSELTASALRHAGRFSKHTYLDPSVISKGPHGKLDEAWRRWAQQESLKRTVFRHLLQCAQRSVVRNMPAQISPFEVSTPIPEDCRFWSAKSAVEWKTLYLESQPLPGEPRLTILDCLSDIRSLDLLPWPQASLLSELSMLYSFLSMLVEDRRRSLLFRRKRDSGWSFTDLTRSPADSHLVFLFTELRDTIEGDPRSASSAIISFMIEFNILFSTTPRYLSDTFLTHNKHVSTPGVFSPPQDWQHTRSSRSAIWHAGQLIRACRRIPPKERTDFHLFGVYHSLLCLWTYWTATKKSQQGSANANRQAASLPRIQLDGPESLESQRWISHNNGIPCLARPQSTAEPCHGSHELVAIEVTERLGQKLPLVDLLKECFLYKITGRHIPMLRHASRILSTLERL